MAWTAPRTWTTGELVTASMMNTHVRDNLLATEAATVTTAGDLAYATGANALARLAPGTSSQVLRSGTSPSWGTVPLAALATVPACRVYSSTSVALTSATWTAVTFNSERYDNDAIHDTGSNTSRLTCKTAGVYAIFATIQTDSAIGRYAALRFLLNGTTTIGSTSSFYQHNSVDASNLMALTTHYKLAVNDYIEVHVWVENSSLNAVAFGNTSPEFGMTYVSAG